MTAIGLISFALVAVLWFLAHEYQTLFGIYVPTHAVRRAHFKVIVAMFMMAAVVLNGLCDVKASLCAGISPAILDGRSVAALLISSMITLSALKFFSVNGSAAYAFLGALCAFVSSGGAAFHEPGRFLGSVLVAPVLAFGLSALISHLLRVTVSRNHVHLIILSYYMRIAVVFSLILTAVSIGLNWGGFLFAGAVMISDIPYGHWVVTGVTGLATVLVLAFMHDDEGPESVRYSDFSIYTTLSAGLATAISILFFSFDASAGLIGLRPVPLSVGCLVTAAIAGAETARKERVIESDDYVREAMGFVAAPLLSFLVAYVLLNVSDGSDDGRYTDFAVMGASVLVLLSLFFAGYVRRQKMHREAMDRLVYSQQQQIYEHSRALNDMELKVVLSENQSLHNAVEMKRQEVMNVALSIVEQKEYLESLNSLVKQLSKTSSPERKDELIGELRSSLKQRLSHDRDVDSQYFYAQAESLHEDFYAKLSENFPTLTPQEKRLATLLRLGFSSKYIATLMNITLKSVEISRYRLRLKLGLSKGDNLVNFIKSI